MMTAAAQLLQEGCLLRLMDIPDKQIPTADPAAVIEQYRGWIKKIASKYAGLVEESGAVDMEDLIQVGSMAILEAQKTFDPEGGRNFTGWSYMPIRNAMLEQLAKALLPIEVKRDASAYQETGKANNPLQSLNALSPKAVTVGGKDT